MSSYDAWKTQSPDDYYDDDWDEPYECDHDDYDVDLLEGRARCYRCGESWFMSESEWTHYTQMQAAANAWHAEQHRPWSRFKEWLTNLRHRWRYGWGAWFRRQQQAADLDDEIPF